MYSGQEACQCDIAAALPVRLIMEGDRALSSFHNPIQSCQGGGLCVSRKGKRGMGPGQCYQRRLYGLSELWAGQISTFTSRVKPCGPQG